jgi:FtsP/CotA-like multicopper oxidase with cupredoxin domain
MTKRDKPYFSAGPRMSRRSLLRGAPLGAASLLAMRSAGPVWGQAQVSAAADHSIRIAPTSLEIAPGKIIQTTAYNGTVPGPVLRLKEGRPVKIEVKNGSGYANLIHWHGLMIPSAQDGATEEGSPIIDPGKSLIYSYVPKPSGTRWYHSHAMAMTDLSKSTYSGEFGFLIVEPPAGDPGSYDREVLLPPTTGTVTGSACRTSRRARRRTTASRLCITPPPWATGCSAMANRSASAKASASCSACSTRAATWESLLPCLGTASRFWRWTATRCRRELRSTP